MGFHFCYFAEYKSENDHRKQRADDGPKDTQCSLLVPHFDIPPAENIKKFPVSPEILPVIFFAAAGFDYCFVIHSNCVW